MADIKMVLVVRKDLNMRKGKIAAQCGHAATGATLQAIFGSRLFEEDFTFGDDGWDIKKPAVNIDGATKEWLAGNFKKVCVSVDSEEELDRIADAANKAGINCCVIVDDGLTFGIDLVCAN